MILERIPYLHGFLKYRLYQWNHLKIFTEDLLDIRRPVFSNEDMKNLILKCLAHQPSGPVGLVMMFHNVEVIPGCSPGPQTQADVKVFLSRLREIIRFARTLQADFVTLSEMRDAFQ